MDKLLPKMEGTEFLGFGKLKKCPQPPCIAKELSFLTFFVLGKICILCMTIVLEESVSAKRTLKHNVKTR